MIGENDTKMNLPKKLIILGTIICVSGVALGWGILPKFVKNKIAQSKALVPGTDSRSVWEKLPFPMIFKVHVFNVTNPNGVHNGETPMLDEIGPIVFDEWKEKVDIEDNSVNDTVKFHMKNTWIFNSQASAPLTGDEIVYIPHPALVGMILTAERERPAVLSLLSKALPSLFNNPETIFLKTNIMDLLFNGNTINCTGTDFPVKAVCTILKKQNTSFTEVEPGIYTFSVFGKKNATKESGEFVVDRGSREVAKVGQMVSYNGQPYLNVWAGEPCNNITGTDSTVFAPFLEKQYLDSFTSDICRSMSAKYEKLSIYKGIPTYHFTSDYGDMSENSDEKCFCPAPDKCLKKGVMDLTKCQGAPLVASLPHFYKAHADYLNGVRGLRPKEEDHGIQLDIEPLTGTPLRAKKRIQFSLPVHAINKINMTENLPDVLLPFMWVEEGIDIKDAIVEEMKKKLFSILDGIDITKWVMTTVGAGIAVTGTALNYINPFARGKLTLTSQQSVGPVEKVFSITR